MYFISQNLSMKEKNHINSQTEREIILEDNDHYWLRFKHGFDKEPLIGKYNKKLDIFYLIGNHTKYHSSNFDIISNIFLRDSQFRDF